jgi:hypothetical protein
VITAVAGVLLSSAGGAVRARRERNARSAATPR